VSDRFPMKAISNELLGQLRRGVENLLLAWLYVHFVLQHVEQGQVTGQWVTLAPILAQESLLAGLFLARRPSTDTSTRPWDWFVGVVGTFLPLTIRPGALVPVLASVGQALQLAGLFVSVTALMTLGRSIGIVAANRGVRTDGLYRMVRHPMYAGHLVVLVGYLGIYPSLRNLAIVATTACALLCRIEVEERLLLHDLTYREYFRHTPCRLIPGVW
jgi:protein-S-isoprenylcysteine O-methyltransferase Ste14